MENAKIYRRSAVKTPFLTSPSCSVYMCFFLVNFWKSSLGFIGWVNFPLRHEQENTGFRSMIKDLARQASQTSSSIPKGHCLDSAIRIDPVADGLQVHGKWVEPEGTLFQTAQSRQKELQQTEKQAYGGTIEDDSTAIIAKHTLYEGNYLNIFEVHPVNA